MIIRRRTVSYLLKQQLITACFARVIYLLIIQMIQISRRKSIRAKTPRFLENYQRVKFYTIDFSIRLPPRGRGESLIGV